MIRPFTCVCMLLAGGSGLYVYQSKHRAQMLDREIARVLKQTDAARDRIGVLRTEWAMLNEPERLAELSQQHLGLRTLNPAQFVAVADLGARLPPVIAPGTVMAAAEEAVPVAAAQAMPQAPAPRIGTSGPRTPASPATVSAPPAVTAPAQVAAVRPPAAPLRSSPRLAQEPREEPVRAALQVPAARPVTPMAPVLSVAAAPIVLAQRPSALAPQTTMSQMPIGDSVLRASALGGTRAALPPPTPYSAR